MANSHSRERAIGVSGGRKGFTLIELLVVLGICIVLASLLLVGIQSERKAVNSVMCQQNLKKIGMGMQEYASDNDGWFPPHWGSDSSGHSLSWYGFIATYVVGWNGDLTTPMAPVFFCPDSSNTRGGSQTYTSTSGNAQGQTYGYNYFHITRNVAAQVVEKRQSILKPAKLVLAADIPQIGSQQPSQSLPASMSQYLMYPAAAVIGLRHPNNSCNVVFADGHVENVNARAFATQGMSFDMTNWNPL